MKVNKDRLGQPLYCGPTSVLDRLCPWRACFNAHDCGRINSRGKWVRDGRCLTRDNRGCPRDEKFRACCDNPRFAPIRPADRCKVCRNCGLRVPVEVIHSVVTEEE